QRQANGALTSAWRSEGLAAYHLTAQPEPDGLSIIWKITNLEMRNWISSAGTVCMQSHNLSAIYDPLGQRSFLRGNGQWVSVDTTWNGPGGNWYLPPGKGALGIMQPYLGKGWSITNFHPDEAIMAVRSTDGEWILAQ